MADIPPAAWAIVQRMFNERRLDYSANEEGARAWTRATCEQLLFSELTGGWCHKSAGPGRPPSKDVVARRIGGRFEGWAVLTAAGANGPRTLTDPPEYYDLTGQDPIEVQPVNHLDVSAPGEPPTDDGGTTEDDDQRELIAACDRIATGLFDVATGLAGLSERIAAVERDGVRVRMGG